MNNMSSIELEKLLLGIAIPESTRILITSHVASQGCFIIKFDGGRDDNKLVWTVILSDGPLGDDFFREDATSLGEALVRAGDFLSKHR